MRYLLFLFIYLYGLLPVKASDYTPLDYLGIEHGLSNNAVVSVFQDAYGFMWFGTYNGLNRFDGYTFKVFRNKLNDSTSLANNWVVAIQEDNKHNIWVGTKQGLSLYNIVQARFSSVYFKPFGKEKNEKLNSAINGLERDGSGNIFIASAGKGLIIHNPENGTTRQVPLFKGKELNLHVQAVRMDTQKRIWLFIQAYGLCLYDYKTESIKVINSAITAGKCLQPDHAGNVWMGTETGLYQYNTVTKKVNGYFESNGFLSANNIHGLSVDRAGVLWISTDGGGVTIYNPKNGNLKYLLPGREKGALTSGAVNTVFEDKDGRKWIGTLRGGLNILDESKNRFKTISHNPAIKNSLLSNFILSFCEDETGNVWIGTDGEGISYWNRKSNTFTNYTHSHSNPSSLSNNNVANILRDFKNEIWIATYGGGVNKFNKSSGTFQYYPCYNPATKNTDRNAWGLFQDRQNNLWVGTCTGGGFYRLNREKNSFELVDRHLGDVIAFAQDSKGTLWAGTFSKLIKVGLNGKKHTTYPIGRAVRSIYEDKRGNFWVGTEGGGLLLFDRKTGNYKTFTETDGLPGNAILNILEDNSGNLWISTFDGLSRFNPAKGEFKNFYESDGLQSNQFNYDAALKLRSGEFLFGGIKGFNVFYPEDIKPFGNKPKLLITGLRTNNIPYEQDDSFEDKTNTYDVEEITLPYDKAVLSVDFAALEYSSPDKIMYSYFLEGWDNTWNNSGKTRVANYSKLREGNYKLHIKSTNAEGAWLNNERILKVRVLPPWWRSWWAYLLYTALASAALYTYTIYQRRQTELNYQVQLANLKIEQEKELNEKKLSFFTHISHEFRTPLTLIINPIKEFLNSSYSYVDPKELIVVYRNARRLLSLVDQLLLFRKSDAEDLKIVKFNLVTFCKEVYLCFSQQAKSRNIQFQFNCLKDEMEIYADKEKIEIALFNLISNAFKYTPGGGSIVLSIQEHEKEVEIHVSDTGPGITAEAGDKLFDKFYQVFDRESSSKAGFGIGLYLVKKFMDSHHGSVSYTSKIGEGTDFKLVLLKGKEHFDPRVIYHEVSQAPVFLDELVEDAPFQSEAAAESVEEDSSFEFVSEKSTILIVDDNQEIRNYIKQLFKQSYTLFEAASGEEGLEVALKQIPDIIITDVVMKELSGVELCTKIKEEPALSHIPVILLTSSSSAEVKLKGIEGGADDFITKPFDKDILIARVSNLLKSRNNLQKYFFNEITLKSDDSKVSGEYKEFLEKCIAITEKHLNNADFNIKTLADEIGTSHSALYKKVKSISGKSINEFIRYIRLRKAAELFANSDCNVNEAAFSVGFSDIKYFREQFSKLFGMKPSEYIKKYRKPFNKAYKLNEKIKKAT